MEKADTVSKAEINNLPCSGFSLIFLYLPQPIPLGCISVFVTLTTAVVTVPIPIYLFESRWGEERGWDILKALCNLPVSEYPLLSWGEALNALKRVPSE